MSKRLTLARAFRASGLHYAMERFPSKPGILIINHHRIGYEAATRFDRKLFSASPEIFDAQLAYLKKLGPIVSCDELEQIVTSGQPLKHFYIAITFDDGYLDNYTNAFDILRSHGASGAFFIVPLYVGTNTVPWWDEIAYLVRNTQRAKLSLTVPVPFEVTLAEDREPAILAVLRHYKRPDNHDGEQFLAELRAQAECEIPSTERRFLNWEEAREMQAAGMTIGSHTATHRILSQLTPQEQTVELTESKQVIEEQLGTRVSTLAYPVGTVGAFNETTQKIALRAGYRMCFSFYNGINTTANLNVADLRRISFPLELQLFRFESLLQAKLGRLPY
jgi:peptidoglycan/xylan/chitin deacetylase (PgdA/CDA1 family)